MKLKNFMFHFTQFRPESTRQRRLHQNSERRERYRRQEEMSVIWKVCFCRNFAAAPFRCAPLKSSRRSYISFENFVSSSVQFLSAASFHKTRTFVTFSSTPFILATVGPAPALRVIFSGQTGPSWPTVLSSPIPSSHDPRLVLKNCGQLVMSTGFLRSLYLHCDFQRSWTPEVHCF